MTDVTAQARRGRPSAGGRGPRRFGRSFGVLCAVAALLAAACGSTVEVPSQVAGGQTAADDGLQAGDEDVASGLAAPEGSSGGMDAAGGSQGGGFVQSGTSGGSGGQAGEGQAAGTQPGTASAGGQNAGDQEAAGGGQAGDKVELGVVVAEDFSAVNDQLGGDFGGLGDNREQAQAVIDEINSRGGLNGVEIVPVWGVRDGGSTASYAEQEQAICSKWTEDHNIYAAVAVVNIYENLLACLANNGRPFVPQHLYPYDQRMYGAYPQTFTPSMLGLDEMAEVYVDRLHAQGYFEEGRVPGEPVRVGLVRYDYPSYARVANEVLRPAMQAKGLDFDAEYAVRPDQSAQEQGNVSAEAQNAVLQFKAQGISHVMLLDRGAYLAIFFMQAAENQNYHPRYGLTSYDGPGIVLQDVAPNQVRDSLGIGWEPLMDVPVEDQPEENAPAKKCRKLMEDAGQDMSSPLTRLVAYQYCDTLWFLEQAVERGGSLTLDAFMAGANGMGGAYVSPITFSTAFAPNRHYGAAAVRDLAYSDDCSCFQYTSDPHPLR